MKKEYFSKFETAVNNLGENFGLGRCRITIEQVSRNEYVGNIFFASLPSKQATFSVSKLLKNFRLDNLYFDFFLDTTLSIRRSRSKNSS